MAGSGCSAPTHRNQRAAPRWAVPATTLSSRPGTPRAVRTPRPSLWTANHPFQSPAYADASDPRIRLGCRCDGATNVQSSNPMRFLASHARVLRDNRVLAMTAVDDQVLRATRVAMMAR